MSKKTKAQMAQEQEDKEQLRRLIKPGQKVYTILRHVSRSGMYRAIDLYILTDDGMFRISGLASDLLEGYDNKHEACRASGCGMDMGFHLVYNLSYSLYPEYECLAEKTGPDAESPYRRCPSPDHVNHGDCRNNTVHHDGYALKQEWL